MDLPNRRSFTLDTNCVIAVEAEEPEAGSIRSLVAAHLAHTADVAVVAISASERQRGGSRISNFQEFRSRLDRLGLGALAIVRPLCYFDVTFFDYCLFAGDAEVRLERAIHETLFPGIPFDSTPNSPPSQSWLNAKCDVQALWSHINAGRDVFVTSDRNFHAISKKPKLARLGAGNIIYPRQAAAMLQG
jgi:hypothetical protein